MKNGWDMKDLKLNDLVTAIQTNG